MAQAQDLRQTITSVSGRPGPILSAYLSVNADIPENQRRAYLVRLRDAMNDEVDLPRARLQEVSGNRAEGWEAMCTALMVHRSGECCGCTGAIPILHQGSGSNLC